MAEEIILGHWIFTKFALPFLLIFFIVYGILTKSKILDDKQQLNALIAFVIGLIFIAAVSPVLVVSNLILFLTIALVVMFVGLLLWGFIAGDEGLKYDKIPKQLKSVILIAILVALFFGTLWAVGIEGETFIGNIGDFLFGQEWSSTFWTNAAFIVVIVIALALVLKGTKGK
jgi:hypothetical protein